MTEIKRADNELKIKLREHLELLALLCDCFDKYEKEILALPIATAIRVLLHDTKNSVSLLGHLQQKNIDFVSTALKRKLGVIYLGLVRQINVGVVDGKGGEAKYWPICSEKYFPAQMEFHELDFESWWQQEVIFSTENGLTLTRKDLVLTMANKDGGAHYDEVITAKYDAFRHSYSGGSTLVGMRSGIKRSYDNVPIHAAIRQIGYEVLVSFDRRSV